MDKNKYIEVEMKDGTIIMCEMTESFFFEGGYYVIFNPVEPKPQHDQPFLMTVTNEDERIFFKMVEDDRTITKIKSFLTTSYDKEHPYKGSDAKDLYRMLTTDVELRNYYQMDDLIKDISIVSEMVNGCKTKRYMVNHHRKEAYDF